jgi:bacillithiol biosynthesis cysteine-adding enzyme BshC
LHTECFPISTLPHATRLFLDYAERREPLSPFFIAGPYSREWMSAAATLDASTRAAVADLLEGQNRGFGAGARAMENIAKLRNGANAVVTGQQVALFGGPLYTLLKVATTIRKAREASRAGHEHVPIFWLATEDHDLDEANHVSFPSRHAMHRLELKTEHLAGEPVGGIKLGEGIGAALGEALALIGGGDQAELLERAYTPGATFGQAFAQWVAEVFKEQGLIVIDASTRGYHALGARVLRTAITEADALHEALAERDALLKARGYHSQVLVSEQASLLFLIDDETGARIALRHVKGEGWVAGKKSYSSEELLAILESEPERLSPNALLRPVFQDAILPTSAYVGGPAEIAYFAQTDVLYRGILGRVTPILPRLSATLIEPDVAKVMAQHELGLNDVMGSRADELAQRLGARAMPIEGKRKLAAAGNALDVELEALTAWMHTQDAGLGRSADVSASKMRYQMNRLRRMAANFQLQRDASLRRHVDALYLNLFPSLHPQERVVGAAWFVARHGDGLAAALVDEAAQECPGHKGIYL